ncbi:Xylanolytic transcriptional activator xlnR [Dirofilaria immitis]
MSGSRVGSILMCRNNDGRSAPGTTNFTVQDYGQRPLISSQSRDPIMDAWSKALEIKSKKEIPPSTNNNSSEVQAAS